jgi:hypothetical protein
MFHGDANITIDAMAQALRALDWTTLEVVGPTHLIVRDDGWPIDVYLEEDEYVWQEADEIAHEFAAGRPDQQYIAACDRRITIAYDPDPEMMVFNTWLIATETMQELTNGRVFDPNEGTFWDYSPK